MIVNKRSGIQEEYDINKIKQVIEWATERLDVNPLELESKCDVSFYDGITTKEIQKNLITNAANMVTVEAPDWKYVAGRLLIMSLWKNLGRKPQERARSYVDFVYNMIASKKYDDTLISVYSEEEIARAGSFIEPDRDLDFDYAGALKIKRSYLIDGESPQEAFMTISLLLASVEIPSERLFWAKQFYDAISLRQISLATPFLGNLRKPNGNVSSCFIVGVGDSLDSITRMWSNVAQISKNGGGVGINLSRIRGKNATIQGVKGASAGIIPSIRVLNDIAIYINQLGKRAGAFTVSIDGWHLDLEDFLELQTENGDQRKKAYDIQPQIVMTDELMRRIENNENITLLDPHEVKEVMGFDLAEAWGDDFTNKYKACEQAIDDGKLELFKVINGRDVIKMVIRNYIETGLPYIAFKDTINKVNPNKHCGYIPSVNLCVESYSNVVPDEEAHTCNLLSLNLANIETEGGSDKELAHICEIGVRMLDNAIELTEAPISESQYHNMKYRTIGVGTMGLADWIAKNGYTYDTGIEEIDWLYERIQRYCVKASIRIAEEREPFYAFEGSMWDTGERIEVYKEKSRDRDYWNHLQVEIMQHGIRNSQITAIAPNTSTSLVQGCTASIWPTFNKIFYDNNAAGLIPVTPPYIKERFWSYKEYKHMDMMKMNDIVSRIQHWIDTGISYEPMFDLNNEHIDVFYIYNFIMDAWKKNIKTLYYVRSVQKDSSMREGSDCESCAG